MGGFGWLLPDSCGLFLLAPIAPFRTIGTTQRECTLLQDLSEGRSEACLAESALKGFHTKAERLHDRVDECNRDVSTVTASGSLGVSDKCFT